LSVLSVCDVDVLWPNGWMIKMKLSKEVGLVPDHIVLDGNTAPLPKGTQLLPPNFRPMSIVAKRSPISATTEHLLKSGRTRRKARHCEAWNFSLLGSRNWHLLRVLFTLSPPYSFQLQFARFVRLVTERKRSHLAARRFAVHSLHQRSSM